MVRYNLLNSGVRKTASFLSVFPMFVPSLSWQNDRFYIYMAQKCRFSQVSQSQSQSQSHAVPTYDASIVLVKSVKVDPELA
jgi:hypothetical protein